MKAKIDLEKFICSLMERYYEKIHIDPTTTKCWLDSVLEDQGLEYKDGEIVEIEQEQPYNKPLFFEKGKWYTCIAKVDGFKVGHTYQSKMDGTVSNDSGAMYMYHNDVNFIFRPATEEEIPHKPPSKPDYEDLSIINEGDDGVLLYFTKDGRGISDFRISKDTTRWLHGKLGEYLEMYDDEQPKEPEERKDLRKRYERISNSDWFKKNHVGISIGEQPLEEDVAGIGELGKVWNEEAIISRLDKIIELLSWKPSPNIIPYPYTQPITYDTNKIYCDTANKEGGEE